MDAIKDIFSLQILVPIIIAVCTCWVIYYGPRRAAKYARELDDERKVEADNQNELNAEVDRKHNIFQQLVKSRSKPKGAAHLGALNLIIIYFPEDEDIVYAFNRYLELLKTTPNSAEFYESFDQVRGLEYWQTELLATMAKKLGYQTSKSQFKESFNNIGQIKGEESGKSSVKLESREFLDKDN